MTDFSVVSAELAGKIREFLHGEADYDPRALLRDVVFETRTTALEAVEAGGCSPPVMVSAADQQGFLRDLALDGTGCMRVVDGIASNVPAALIHKPANGGYPASHEHRLRGAIANTRWSDVPLDKLRAVAEALSPQERAPGAMTALHERLQDVIADMRAHANNDRQAEYGEDDSVSISYVLGWADRLEAATALQSSGGEVVAGKLEGDDRLLWGVVANAGRLSHERKVRWSHVMDATSMGSTSSAALCRRFGFDPGETVGIEDQDEADDVTASPAQPSDGWQVPETMDDETRWILGRVCFMTIRTAQRLRELGVVIECRAEDEQAAVIHWMLGLYAKHGKNWRAEGEKILATIPAAPAPIEQESK